MLVVETVVRIRREYAGGKPIKAIARDLRLSRKLFPFIRLVWADGGDNSERVTGATNVRVEIVSKIADQVGFVVLPRRWVVERLFAWINRNRRLAKDVEASIKSAAAFLYAAASMLMIRRLARLS